MNQSNNQSSKALSFLKIELPFVIVFCIFIFLFIEIVIEADITTMSGQLDLGLIIRTSILLLAATIALYAAEKTHQNTQKQLEKAQEQINLAVKRDIEDQKLKIEEATKSCLLIQSGYTSLFQRISQVKRNNPHTANFYAHEEISNSLSPPELWRNESFLFKTPQELLISIQNIVNSLDHLTSKDFSGDAGATLDQINSMLKELEEQTNKILSKYKNLDKKGIVS